MKSIGILQKYRKPTILIYYHTTRLINHNTTDLRLDMRTMLEGFNNRDRWVGTNRMHLCAKVTESESHKLR
jgi:hypothetical protein